MYEVSCPTCLEILEYDTRDAVHLCPNCSCSFQMDIAEGTKSILSDHYILPVQILEKEAEASFWSWAKSRYHKDPQKDIVLEKKIGSVLPFWVISLEAHTQWSGYIYPKQDPVLLEGKWSQRYRWAVLAKEHSYPETWGITQLHQPIDLDVKVEWDGFPLDESLGLDPKTQKSMYTFKNPFKFEFASGLTVENIRDNEDKAISKAKDHVQSYHRALSQKKIEKLINYRTEIEIVGTQILHVPMWQMLYRFEPKGMLALSPKRKHVLIQGFTGEVLQAEIPVTFKDKMSIHTLMISSITFFSLMLSVFYHPLFFIAFMLFLSLTVLATYKSFFRLRTIREQDDLLL
jgi:hypothetical protein